MTCHNCGKEIGNDYGFCPYCGASVYTNIVEDKGNSTTYHNREDEMVKSNKFGMAGFVLSIVSLFLSVYLVVPILGVVLSGVGCGRKSSFNQWNKLATAGLVISIITLVIYLIYYLLEGFGFAIYF